MRLAVLAAGGTPSVSVYPANWGGLIRAIDDLKVAISASTAYSDEQAQDAVGGILTDSASIDLTYNDGANTITAAAIFGVTGGTVCQGNDARLSDTRTPTDSSVTNAKVAAGAAISLSKLAVDPSARANHTGTQLASTVSDFSEAVDDRVAGLLVAGTAITLTYNDAAGSLTIDATGAAYTDEAAQDAVGAILTDSTSIDLTYNDGANTITAAAIFGTTAGTVAEGNHNQTAATITDFSESVQDAVGAILTDSTSIDLTYNDGANTITAAAIFGTTATTVCVGNDARLSDTRTPTDGSVTNAKVAVGAAIDLAKLATNPLARANHTGTQLASTVSDFTAATQLVPLGLVCQGRLTFTSGTGLTTADVTAATTVYFTPYTGNGVRLWNGSAWQLYTFTELSLALTGLTANTNYDVFLHDNAGTLTLTAVAWTNSTTRASAISLRNGVYVKTSDDRLLLGSFRTTGTVGQSEDSLTKRFLSNAYNRELRRLSVGDSTASWSYAVASTWRQTRATATNQVEVLLSLAGYEVSVLLQQRNAGAGLSAIGLDSTTTPATDGQAGGIPGTADAVAVASLDVNNIALGYHTLAMLEYTTSTTTFYGLMAGGTIPCSTLKGFVMG